MYTDLLKTVPCSSYPDLTLGGFETTVDRYGNINFKMIDDVTTNGLILDANPGLHLKWISI